MRIELFAVISMVVPVSITAAYATIEPGFGPEKQAGPVIDYDSFMNPDGSVNLTEACYAYMIMPGEKTAQGLTQCLPYLNSTTNESK